MSKRHSVWIGIGVLMCVAAGMALEHVRQSLLMPETVDSPVVEDVRPALPARQIVKVRDESAERAAAALRQRVAELERALAEKPLSSITNPPAQVAERPQEDPERGDRSRRQSFTERMEQMRKENPEQYAEMQKRREEFRQRMEQRALDRADFLAAVDVRNMDNAQRENHEKLLATVARMDELMAQMGQSETRHDPAVRQELGETFSVLNELYGEERRYLLEATAREVGYEGAQATEFADQVQAIIDNTSMMPPPGFGHGGGRGGPPRQ